MAVTPVSKTYGASVRGLNTDGNELSVLEQSNLSESNYELLEDGTRRRRRPIIEENAFRPSYMGVSEGTAVSSFLWKTPGNRDNISFVVEQNDDIIRFYQVNHDAPAHVRANELSEQLHLTMFGPPPAVLRANPVLLSQCTYDEGQGNLYVFNEHTGTIKVEYLEEEVLGDRLRFTAIGTWIRDYRGAEEEQNIDFRPLVTEPLDAYSDTIPLLPESLGITAELRDDRAYNLSNTGWDAKSIAEYAVQSGKDYTVRDPNSVYQADDATVVQSDPNPPNNPSDKGSPQQGGYYYKVNNPAKYPALTDRYLDGRLISAQGDDVFSFPQLVEAKENKSRPPMGARIMSSERGAAGTLTGLPNNMLNSHTVDLIPAGPGAGAAIITLTFDNRVFHTEPRPDDVYGVFIHHMSFIQNVDGVARQGGFSGFLRADAVPGSNGKQLQFRWNLGLGDPFTSGFALTSLLVHPSPEFFAHALPDNTHSYDYRGAERPAAGAFFSGRLWQTADQHNRIYYSQIVEMGQYGRGNRGVQNESLCFQAADPTDGDDNALVASDGGYISLPDSGTHYGLEVLGNSLLILTDNGIWAVVPGERGYFVADDFRVIKLSNSEVLGRQAVVNTGSEVHVCTDEGILKFAGTERGGIGTDNMTFRTIQTEYDKLIDERRLPVGAYDPDSRVIRWSFPITTEQVSSNVTDSCVMLSYSMVHQAWTRYDLGANGSVVSMIVLPYTADTTTYNRFRYLILTPNVDVPAISSQFLSEWGIEVDITAEGADRGVNAFDPDERFADYVAPLGTLEPRDPVPAYMQTHHYLYGEGQRWASIKYATSYLRNVSTKWIEEVDGSFSVDVPGSTLLTGRWDWSDTLEYGKYSKPHETYKFRRRYMPTGLETEYDVGEPLIVTKTKVRGRGREFRLYWESNGHADSHIVGWSIDGLVNNGV